MIRENESSLAVTEQRKPELDTRNEKLEASATLLRGAVAGAYPVRRL